MGTDAAPTEAPARPPSGARCPCCGAVVPTHRGDRRLTLLDVMILVAASALAALLVRPVLAGPLRTYPSWSTYLAVAIGGLVAWTPAVLFLRLRRPRPNLRRLTRQPGFAASLAGTMVVALGLLATGLLALVRASLFGSAARAGVRPTPPDPSWWIGVVLHFGAVVGPAVLGAWLLLALSGRRRPAPGGLDLIGRAIGVAWIILFVINGCVRLASLRQ